MSRSSIGTIAGIYAIVAGGCLAGLCRAAAMSEVENEQPRQPMASDLGQVDTLTEHAVAS